MINLPESYLREQFSSQLNELEQQQAFREYVLDSTDAFSEELLEVEDEVTYQNPWHIRIVYDLLDNVLTQEVNEDGSPGKIVFNREGKVNRKVVIEIPRNHAKSTSASVNWPTKELYRDRNLRIVIASSVLTQASSFLREIKAHLERGALLTETLGSIVPQYPEKWTDTQIIVNRTTKKKDASISTVGTGGSVLARRTDIGILDDILNPDNTRTPEQREKVEYWVNNVFRPTIEPKTGRQIVVGTVWYKGDYLDARMEDKTFDVRLQLRAYIRDSKTKKGAEYEHALDIRSVFSDEVIEAYGISADEGVLWPERWPHAELENEKEGMGTVAFNRQYMNIVISEDTQIIQTEWLTLAKKFGDKFQFLPYYNVSTCPYGPLVVVQGVDLAISEKERADWTVIVTLGRDMNGKIYLLNIVRGHFSPGKIRSNMVMQYELFDPMKIKVENNAFQESLRKDMADYTDLPVEGYTTGGEKFDEYIGINSVGVAFENQRIVLPYSPDMPPAQKKLVDQFVFEAESFGFTGHTGDILMAFWFAMQGLRELKDSNAGAIVQSEGFYKGRRNDRINNE